MKIDHTVVTTDGFGLQIDVMGNRNERSGAFGRYEIRGFNTFGNLYEVEGESINCLPILFQDRSPAQGNTGVTMEALITVCEHRLTDLQKGAFACDENERALNHLKMAIQALNDRTIRINTPPVFS